MKKHSLVLKKQNKGVLVDHGLAFSSAFKPLPKTLGSTFDNNKRKKLSVHMPLPATTWYDGQMCRVEGTRAFIGFEELSMDDFKVFVAAIKLFHDGLGNARVKHEKMVEKKKDEEDVDHGIEDVRYVLVPLVEIAKSIGVQPKKQYYSMIKNALARLNTTQYYMDAEYYVDGKHKMVGSRWVNFPIMRVSYVDKETT